jgi:uncharacterized membrane protein
MGVFFAYGFIGWIVESIYMSWCNKRITNRGFARGPFCPIYGVGEFILYALLSSFADNLLAVYVLTALAATGVEYVVARMMIYKFGYVWWDYSNKPFNYKGILCLESTLAWGIYGICEVTFLRTSIITFWNRFPEHIQVLVFAVISVAYILDCGTRYRNISHGEIKEKENDILRFDK